MRLSWKNSWHIVFLAVSKEENIALGKKKLNIFEKLLTSVSYTYDGMTVFEVSFIFWWVSSKVASK